MDTYFVQFYKESEWWFAGREKTIDFRNGFSSAYRKLKDKGDFIWLPEGQEIPIDSGKIYVSAMFSPAIMSVVETARRNSQLEIIMGGAAFHRQTLQDGIAPRNLKIISQTTVQDYFDIEYNPNDWGLELPSEFDEIGYHIAVQEGSGCNWAKCIFCKHEKSAQVNYKLRSLDIPIIDHDGIKCIWFFTSSLLEDDIVKSYLSLPDRDDLIIGSYSRGDKQMYNAFKKHFPNMKLDPANLVFSLGVEMPSNRILKYIKKGTTTEYLTKTINLLQSFGSTVHINMMLGFNNLQWDDYDQVKEFFNTVDTSKMALTIYKLTIVEDREIFRNPPGELRPITWHSEMKFPMAYECVMDEKQTEINTALHKLYYDLDFMAIQDVSKFNSFEGRELGSVTGLGKAYDNKV